VLRIQLIRVRRGPRQIAAPPLTSCEGRQGTSRVAALHRINRGDVVPQFAAERLGQTTQKRMKQWMRIASSKLVEKPIKNIVVKLVRVRASTGPTVMNVISSPRKRPRRGTQSIGKLTALFANKSGLSSPARTRAFQVNHLAKEDVRELKCSPKRPSHESIETQQQALALG
jgi:hypothetical protein